MTEPYRRKCPHCGSRQISSTRSGPICTYKRCSHRRVDPVDLLREDQR